MSTIVLDLEADRVLAVEATSSRGRVKVRRAFTAEVPESVREEANPEAVGRWVREQLDEHGMKSKSAIVAAARGEVLVKRLEAPAASLNRAERHEMIRMQMARQASMTSASSVIDYVEHEEGVAALAEESKRGDETESESTVEEARRSAFVVASAMPTARVQAREETVKAAGLKLEGIRLRTAGVRALLADEHDPARPTLVVHPGIGSVELMMLIGGEIVFSRSVTVGLPEPGDPEGSYAERVAVEASRTLVSFRVMADGHDIDRAVVLAGGRIGAALSQEIGERLHIPGQSLDPATLIEFDESVDERHHPAIAPLAGLLLCKHRGIKAHDFANPTEPPDTTAGVRQAVMGGLFLLIVLAGVGYLFAQRSLSAAERQQAAAKERSEDWGRKYVARQINGGRLGHIRAWTAQTIDWPAHMAHIMQLLPDAETISLEQMSVSLGGGAAFTPGEQLGDLEAWSSAGTMTISISGVSRDREAVAAFREQLLGSGIYTVSSQGPEVQNRFSLQIATAVPSPMAPARSGGEDADAGDAGGESGEREAQG